MSKLYIRYSPNRSINDQGVGLSITSDVNSIVSNRLADYNKFNTSISVDTKSDERYKIFSFKEERSVPRRNSIINPTIRKAHLREITSSTTFSKIDLDSIIQNNDEDIIFNLSNLIYFRDFAVLHGMGSAVDNSNSTSSERLNHIFSLKKIISNIKQGLYNPYAYCYIPSRKDQNNQYSNLVSEFNLNGNHPKDVWSAISQQIDEHFIFDWDNTTKLHINWDKFFLLIASQFHWYQPLDQSQNNFYKDYLIEQYSDAFSRNTLISKPLAWFDPWGSHFYTRLKSYKEGVIKPEIENLFLAGKMGFRGIFDRKISVDESGQIHDNFDMYQLNGSTSPLVHDSKLNISLFYFSSLIPDLLGRQDIRFKTVFHQTGQDGQYPGGYIQSGIRIFKASASDQFVLVATGNSKVTSAKDGDLTYLFTNSSNSTLKDSNLLEVEWDEANFFLDHLGLWFDYKYTFRQLQLKNLVLSDLGLIISQQLLSNNFQRLPISIERNSELLLLPSSFSRANEIKFLLSSGIANSRYPYYLRYTTFDPIKYSIGDRIERWWNSQFSWFSYDGDYFKDKFLDDIYILFTEEGISKLYSYIDDPATIDVTSNDFISIHLNLISVISKWMENYQENKYFFKTWTFDNWFSNYKDAITQLIESVVEDLENDLHQIQSLSVSIKDILSNENPNNVNELISNVAQLVSESINKLRQPYDENLLNSFDSQEKVQFLRIQEIRASKLAEYSHSSDPINAFKIWVYNQKRLITELIHQISGKKISADKLSELIRSLDSIDQKLFFKFGDMLAYISKVIASVLSKAMLSATRSLAITDNLLRIFDILNFPITIEKLKLINTFSAKGTSALFFKKESLSSVNKFLSHETFEEKIDDAFNSFKFIKTMFNLNDNDLFLLFYLKTGLVHPNWQYSNQENLTAITANYADSLSVLNKIQIFQVFRRKTSSSQNDELLTISHYLLGSPIISGSADEFLLSNVKYQDRYLSYSHYGPTASTEQIRLAHLNSDDYELVFQRCGVGLAGRNPFIQIPSKNQYIEQVELITSNFGLSDSIKNILVAVAEVMYFSNEFSNSSLTDDLVVTIRKTGLGDYDYLETGIDSDYAVLTSEGSSVRNYFHNGAYPIEWSGNAGDVLNYILIKKGDHDNPFIIDQDQLQSLQKEFPKLIQNLNDYNRSLSFMHDVLQATSIIDADNDGIFDDDIKDSYRLAHQPEIQGRTSTNEIVFAIPANYSINIDKFKKIYDVFGVDIERRVIITRYGFIPELGKFAKFVSFDIAEFSEKKKKNLFEFIRNILADKNLDDKSKIFSILFGFALKIKSITTPAQEAIIWSSVLAQSSISATLAFLNNKGGLISKIIASIIAFGLTLTANVIAYTLEKVGDIDLNDFIEVDYVNGKVAPSDFSLKSIPNGKSIVAFPAPSLSSLPQSDLIINLKISKEVVGVLGGVLLSSVLGVITGRLSRLAEHRIKAMKKMKEEKFKTFNQKKKEFQAFKEQVLKEETELQLALSKLEGNSTTTLSKDHTKTLMKRVNKNPQIKERAAELSLIKKADKNKFDLTPKEWYNKYLFDKFGQTSVPKTVLDKQLDKFVTIASSSAGTAVATGVSLVSGAASLVPAVVNAFKHQSDRVKDVADESHEQAKDDSYRIKKLYKEIV